MNYADIDRIKNAIAIQHEGDEAQLEVIFSECMRIIVEAPAGYGKTTTMISRIAYLFASGRIPNPKRILALTFSVNAALKVKREVAEKLPLLIGTQNNPVAIGEKATITNYHGFCKGVLKKYGYLLTPSLRKDVNLLRAIGDSEVEKHQSLIATLKAEEIDYMKKVEGTIKDARYLDAQTIFTYNDIVTRKLIPLDYITHNAIITYVLELFEKQNEVRSFYKNYYTLIVADEFQDTNSIALSLLEAIISDHTQLLFLGDPLQRIYGFIGALPGILDLAVEKYNMHKISLSKNYRFRNNLEMLKLDKNIRENAVTCFSPEISTDLEAKLPGFWGTTQQNEAEQIAHAVQAITCNGAEKTAILFRGRSKNAESVEDELLKLSIPYFYGMFTDEDTDYIRFHDKCQAIFIHKFGKRKTLSQKALTSFVDSVKTEFSYESSSKIIASLLKLLSALINKVAIDYAGLLPEEKYTLILDIFENRQLKQAMEYVDSKVILSTIHGAKGLEWDYVILGDVERWVFPGFYVCNNCPSKYTSFSKYRCSMPNPLPSAFKDAALDELSVFYVGITRAKKQAYVSASAKRLDYKGTEKPSLFSCMIGLKGIKLVEAT